MEWVKQDDALKTIPVITGNVAAQAAQRIRNIGG
jgi:hypothetical protein